MISEKSISNLYELYVNAGGRVTTDSRRVTELSADGFAGPIYFALKGDRFDGNDFALDALRDGASVAVVERKPNPLPENFEAAVFLVEDALETLQELARRHREVLGLPIISLTGTNGKTTTKELLVRVLSTRYRTASTQGNLNNHIGVPLTLLSFTEEDDLGIVEMGANHRGEIGELCQIARPDYGLITNIGRAHLDGFGGEMGVRAAKGELYDWLESSGGKAFYNEQDAILSEMIRERSSLADQAIPYSYSGLGLSASSQSNNLSLWVAYGEAEYSTHLCGDFNLDNITSAVAVGNYFGVETFLALSEISRYVPTNNRSQVAQCSSTGNTVYMDAYNANPSSVTAALDYFLALPDGEKVVILGDMFELGADALKEHVDVVERLLAAVERESIRALLVGENFSRALSARHIPLHEQLTAFADTDSILLYLADNPISDSLVLVKGSRGMKLEKLYPALCPDPAPRKIISTILF